MPADEDDDAVLVADWQPCSDSVHRSPEAFAAFVARFGLAPKSKPRSAVNSKSKPKAVAKAPRPQVLALVLPERAPKPRTSATHQPNFTDDDDDDRDDDEDDDDEDDDITDDDLGDDDDDDLGVDPDGDDEDDSDDDDDPDDPGDDDDDDSDEEDTMTKKKKATKAERAHEQAKLKTLLGIDPSRSVKAQLREAKALAAGPLASVQTEDEKRARLAKEQIG